MIAAIGGLLGGTTAVHGLRQNQYGPANPPALFTGASRADGKDYGGYGSNGEYAEAGVSGCAGCSERDLGYRWASLTQVRASADCPNDSWGFRRGCLDYTGGI